MDPQACYDELLDALNEKRHDEALDHIDDLREWVRKGGFLPKHINMKWVWNIGRQLNQAQMVANGEYTPEYT